MMTTTLTARFDGKVLIPAGHVDLPQGAILRLRVEMPDQPRPGVPASPSPGGSLADLEACGIWADRTDLGDTSSAARKLRRASERREDDGR